MKNRLKSVRDSNKFHQKYGTFECIPKVKRVEFKFSLPQLERTVSYENADKKFCVEVGYPLDKIDFLLCKFMARNSYCKCKLLSTRRLIE